MASGQLFCKSSEISCKSSEDCQKHRHWCFQITKKMTHIVCKYEFSPEYLNTPSEIPYLRSPIYYSVNVNECGEPSTLYVVCTGGNSQKTGFLTV